MNIFERKTVGQMKSRSQPGEGSQEIERASKQIGWLLFFQLFGAKALPGLKQSHEE